MKYYSACSASVEITINRARPGRGLHTVVANLARIALG